LPVTVTVEKTPGFALRVTFAGKGERSRIVEVALQSGAQPFDPVVEYPAQQHHAIALETGDIHGVGLVGRQLAGIDADTGFLPVDGLRVDGIKLLHNSSRAVSPHRSLFYVAG
jgi:hypothetical protein